MHQESRFAVCKSDKLVLILHKSFSIASNSHRIHIELQRQSQGRKRIEKNWLINFQMFSGRFELFFGDFSSSIERRNIFWLLKKSQVWNNFEEDDKKWIFLLNSLADDFLEILNISFAFAFIFRKMFTYEYNKEAQSRLLIDFPYLLFVISFVHMKLCLICCCLFPKLSFSLY